jgi:hypothetical protein
MAKILILLVIVGIIAGLIWMFRGKPPVGRSRSRDPGRYASLGVDEDSHATLGGLEKLKNNPRFWGVEMGQPGCEAAIALLGRQYTFEEAPRLPLEGCDAAMCTCQFKGLVNRRVQQRRKQQERRVEVRFEKDNPDRRSRKDRRRSDKWTDHTL